MPRRPWPTSHAPRTVQTSGESSIHVVPDKVVVSFGIETRDAALDAAKSRNASEAARLLKAIKALGIEADAIQSDVLTVTLEYSNRHAITGYMARRNYSVTLKDPKAFEGLVDTVLNNGANQILGFQFLTTELRKHRDEAPRLAIRAAREKAGALASELGCGVGKPLTIVEGGSNGYGYYGGWGGGNVSQVNAFSSAPGGNQDAGETVMLGRINVTAQVSVTFELTDR